MILYKSVSNKQILLSLVLLLMHKYTFSKYNGQESRMGKLKIHPLLKKSVKPNSNVYYLENSCKQPSATNSEST